ncbi:5'-3' exonuclease [Evansella vedderi]|uniref:5'-3' exonuclease n=1 Tax=Evansella vedderi TaxID=38282 RepID=A0ABT9ZW55_9BACI|nr:5'-3' exonuclease H3TH domain-containing protein [Evansella vedderi]MDQ0255463.1 5'-3' exonuclease [Evansella vedderi]
MMKSSETIKACRVALPNRHTFITIKTCLLSLIAQLKKEKSVRKVEGITVRNGWMEVLLSEGEVKDCSVDDRLVKGEEGIKLNIQEKLNVESCKCLIEDLTNHLISSGMKQKSKTINTLIAEDGIFKIEWEKGVPQQEINTNEKVTSIRKKSKTPDETLVVIDGNNMLSRSHFATAYRGTDDLMRTADGRYTNGVYGFINMLFKLLEIYKPTNLAVTFDVSRSSTFRRQIHPEYKGLREETDPILKEQFDTLQYVLDKMSIPYFKVDSFEADDLIGTFVKEWSNKKGTPCYMVSNDKDLYQLLDGNVFQVYREKKQDVVISKDNFIEKYGIQPYQWIDAKAIMGESGKSSDNIPGINGIGLKGALDLLASYSSLDDIYANIDEIKGAKKKKLDEGKDDAYLSKKLVTIRTDVPDIQNINLDDLRIKLNRNGTLEVFEELEFTSLLEKIS